MHNKAKLIRDFFGLSGTEAIRQIRELTDVDRVQLASAIARHLGIAEAGCDFSFVDY